MPLISPTKSLISKVRDTIRHYRMIEPAAGVIVGVSGGPDSVALIHILDALKSEMGFWFVAAHLDHKLRSESRKDAEFVREMCQALGIRIEVAAMDVRATAIKQGVSVEEAGRGCRYNFFEEVRVSHSADMIATAHHIDDELETFFLRIFRGSSLHGIKGIAPVRGRIIHPLIRVERADIISYLDAQRIPYRVDPTNLEAETDRNFVRNRLFPVVSEGFPGFRNPLRRTLAVLEKEDEFLDMQATKLCSEAISISDDSLTLDVERLRSAPEILAARALLIALYQSAGSGERWSMPHIESLMKALQSDNPSARLHLPGGFVAQRVYKSIVICRLEPQQPRPVDELVVTSPGAVEFLGLTLEFRIHESEGKLPEKPKDASIALFDADNAVFPLTLRTFRPGDRFRPWGLEGTRKLKKLLIDLKVPSGLRREIPLLVKDGEILWVTGIRRGQAAAVLPETRRILEVKLVKGLEKLRE